MKEGRWLVARISAIVEHQMHEQQRRMCHRYSVIAPELPIAASHHTRGRRAHRAIAGGGNRERAHHDCVAGQQ